MPAISVAASENAVTVSFSLPYHCDYGQNLSISGSNETLGKWDLSQCINMTWNDGDIWSAALSFPARWVHHQTSDKTPKPATLRVARIF